MDRVQYAGDEDARVARAATHAFAEPFWWAPVALRNRILGHYRPNRLVPLSPKREAELEDFIMKLSGVWFETFPNIKLRDGSRLVENPVLAVAFIDAVVASRGGLDPNNSEGVHFQKGWLKLLVERWHPSVVAQLPDHVVTEGYTHTVVQNFFNSLGKHQARRQGSRREAIKREKSARAAKAVAELEEQLVFLNRKCMYIFKFRNL